MKICILGNSHIGSLKRAWDLIEKNYPSVSITFFGGRSNTLSELYSEKNKLVTDSKKLKNSFEFTSGGVSEVEESLYDVFLVYGLGFNCNASFLNEEFSENFKKEILKEAYKMTTSYHVASCLRSITSKKIYIGHVPLPSFEGEKSPHHKKNYEEIYDIYNFLIDENMKLSLIKQPCITIDSDNYTKSHFAKGSKRLAVGASNDNELHPLTDTGHMNDDFGKIWMESFLERFTNCNI